jgi:hypothetical protein
LHIEKEKDFLVGVVAKRDTVVAELKLKVAELQHSVELQHTLRD